MGSDIKKILTLFFLYDIIYFTYVDKIFGFYDFSRNLII